jgi:Arc/MetJ-type ribon-helix-helix transcriptional regulator
MTTQIAVKLPDELVARLDELVRRGRFPSRSTGVRRALEALLVGEERRRIDAAFTEGFRRIPDDGPELAEATRLALEAIAEEPWERWW